MGQEMIYIFDIDGTLSDLSHRLHFIQQTPQDWDAFYKACTGDQPILGVLFVMKAIYNEGHIVVLSTGRSTVCKDETLEWLNTYKAPFDGLYMRKAKDHREDNVVKAELLEDIRKDWPNHPIAGVFEDRQQVVDMYRSQGIKVFQVAEGKF
jgi:phosphoglycolate phosphatase-like HAD superfamily hydrolase